MKTIKAWAVFDENGEIYFDSLCPYSHSKDFVEIGHIIENINPDTGEMPDSTVKEITITWEE